MKRSEINTIILEADEMIKSFGYHLPDFAYWSAEKFKEKQIAVSYTHLTLPTKG